MLGAVMMLPLDTAGFAPTQMNSSVRSTSGTGISSWLPNISSAASICGNASTEFAEYRLRVPRLRNTSCP